jgi:hypothetical protein
MSCSKEPSYRESLIKVDSISIELIPTYMPDELYAINLHGTISANGCSSLSYIKTFNQDPDLIIEAWKKTKVDAIACPTVMVYLDYRIVLFKKSLPANFLIKVKQPDGTFLEKSLPD